MIKIGILGDIGSGKSYVAQNFGYPVFNADDEVAKAGYGPPNRFIPVKIVVSFFDERCHEGR